MTVSLATMDNDASPHRHGSAATSGNLLPEQLQLLGEVLGEGSCGEVLLGRWHTNDGTSTEVAVKYATDPVKAQRLRHEDTAYKQMQELQGICIPTVVASGPLGDGSGHFIALERIHGEMLKPQHRKQAAIMEAALAAVRSVNSKGVLHMDLRPCNMLVAADGRFWLLDFSHANLDLDSFSAEDADLLRRREEYMIKGSIFAAVAWQ